VALVVFLRGVNVGGHRVFRPARLAAELKHLRAVNLGAAGTFVFTRPIARTVLRAELARRLPFATEIVICEGREILKLLAHSALAGHPARPGTVRFVTVLSRQPRHAPPASLTLPARGRWLLRLLMRDGRFVVGEYRRDPRVIWSLGVVDGHFGVPCTTRNWNTMLALAKLLESHTRRGSAKAAR